MNDPKVFISYSHDTATHKQWVLELATHMRSSGINTILDQWDLKPGDDIPHFMETSLEIADYIVMVCTKKYVEKANSGIGGVGYEKMVITSVLMERIHENKIIPIIRNNEEKLTPTFLKSKLFIDFNVRNTFESSLDWLVRTIHKRPLQIKPPIGKNPFDQEGNLSQEKSADERQTLSNVRDLMKAVVHIYENGKTPWVTFRSVQEFSGISSIFLGRLIEEAVALGYIELDSRQDLNITEVGNTYAIEEGFAY